MRQERKNTRADIVLAALLVLGALVLAAVSWQLPNTLQLPMTGNMVGTVSLVEGVYDDTRMGIALEGNSNKYTLPMETYEALPKEIHVGDDVVMKYEISYLHEIRYLELRHDDGTKEALYRLEDPMEKTVRNRQILAFALYGVFAAVCIAGYGIRRKKVRR